jgi:hypothetical protein
MYERVNNICRRWFVLFIDILGLISLHGGEKKWLCVFAFLENWVIGYYALYDFSVEVILRELLVRKRWSNQEIWCWSQDER